MWMPNRTTPRAQRTPSIHSIASIHSTSRPKSIAMSHSGAQSEVSEHDQHADTAHENNRFMSGRQHVNTVPPIWQQERQHSGSAPRKAVIELGSNVGYAKDASLSFPRSEYKNQWETATDDDATSRSSTLDGDEEYMDHPQKKAISMANATKHALRDEPRSPIPAPRVPGPLESQLAALMSKLIYLEHANPVVSIRPEEYEEMQARLKGLEEEKKQWWKRHEAIWALRDDDVENNIKIRGLLAKCRRELDQTKALREEDLANVQLVRTKLAEKTRELDRLQAQTGRASPPRVRPGSFFERRDTSDLFAAAKTAALEQRALELEKRNADLVAQVQTLKGGANIDDLNRLTAHQAWKDKVADLESRLKAKDAEVARLRADGTPTGGRMDWNRVEALFEEHASYREAVGGKLQGLRSEKEALLKDLHRKEDECQALELKVQSAQRRLNVL